MVKPLEGIRILELGTLVAAPFAGKIFAEFGGEVIKVEDPKKGDLYVTGVYYTMTIHLYGGVFREGIRNR
ncbi:CoA-transferase family III [Alteribacillus bidgolensis]|uniref:CoA-transferase family III n=1 Tax=Alteribacillus bidgolensis TaxID=930129 RepID=A0A1G8I9Z6_9BACI|nr:CoA-transferase family III [Alteribacillus bidgolensis]